MCGLAGYINFDNNINQQSLKDGLQMLAHRGPDDEDTAFFDTQYASIGLGHRRLAILDLSALGHQPMYSADQNIVIVLNGEIYNFKEIRDKLQQLGYQFQSNSDTEVVIYAYQAWGMSCLKEFIGMFAFALYDRSLQKVFLVRDRAGVKPLYYTQSGNNILFASELKAFHSFECFDKSIHPTALSLFFKYGYIRAPYTIFNHAYKLLPGHWLEIDLATAQQTMHQYWDIVQVYSQPLIDVSEAEALERLNDLCQSAFQYRMVSDVPVGVFLSGGYDSALVTALLQKNSANQIKTFTIGFEDAAYNEAQHAKKVAAHLGTAHHEYYCTTKEAQDIIPQLPFFYDEPFGDSSAIPTTLVSRFAREQVTVSLSADGGDEIFAGYNRYNQLLQLQKIRAATPGWLRQVGSKLLLAGAGNQIKRKKQSQLLSAADNLYTGDLISQHFLDEQLKELLKYPAPESARLFDRIELPKERTLLDQLLVADYSTYMVDDILTKVDRATMSVALEGREPLLDHRIVEYVAQLPNYFKYKAGDKKYLLKQLVHQHIPEGMMNRPKMGFGIPFGKWMRGDLKALVLATVNASNLRKHGLLHEAEVMRILQLFMDGHNSYEWQVWLIFMFQLWWNQWM